MADDAPRGRSGPPDISTLFSVKVDNLSYDTTADDLRPVFEKYGKIADMFLPKDRNTGRPRGFAFVRYHEQAHADEAIARESNQEMRGRAMRCELAKYGRGEGPVGSSGTRGPVGGGDRDRGRGDDRGGRGGYDDRGHGGAPAGGGGGGYGYGGAGYGGGGDRGYSGGYGGGGGGAPSYGGGYVYAPAHGGGGGGGGGGGYGGGAYGGDRGGYGGGGGGYPSRGGYDDRGRGGYDGGHGGPPPPRERSRERLAPPPGAPVPRDYDDRR